MHLKKHKLLTQKGAYALFCFFLSLCSFSQSITNLVNNYSFESFNTCPIGNDNIKNSNYWFKATIACSPDYFNACSSSSFASVPLNANGYRTPKTGSAYSGLLLYTENLSNAREYIENGLSKNLKANKIYCISFYISLGQNTRFASNNMSFLFSNDSIREYSPIWPPYTLTYTPNYINTSVIMDTINWIQIQTTYLADGTEKFITIGNFKNDASTTFTPSKPYVMNNSNNTAYYYLDDVSILEINSANAGIKDTLVSRCFMDSVALGTDSTEFANYTWQSTAAGMAALSCTNCPNPIAKPLVTTKYYLTKQQCSTTTKDSVTVIVLTPTTQANAGSDKTICLGDAIQIGTQDSLAFTNYVWINSTNLSCTNCAMPFANPNATTTYTVQRTECNVVTKDSVKIIIDDCEPIFTVPNVFTPNYDGVNDTWGVSFSTVNSHITNFKMSIYDRWGLLVYETNPDASTPKSKWDGATTAGIACNAGVYFYVITFDKNNEAQKLTGHLSLFR